MGAVLLQVQQNGRRAPVAYISRALTDTEKRYPQIEKEALAVTWGCERFAQYLIGEEPFTVETDHKPLIPILNTQNFSQCPPRLQGLKMRLAPFSYRVEFVPGKDLLVADTLSRAPVEKGNNSISEEIEMHLSMVTVAGIPASDEFFTRLADETEKDPELSRLMPYLLYEWPRTRQQVHQEVRAYWDSRHLFSTEKGIVFRGERIFIPRTLRKEMIGVAHEGHLGIAKTKARAREHMWWPGMARALEEAVIRCQTCAQFRHQQQKEPLMMSQLPERPWQQVQDQTCLSGKADISYYWWITTPGSQKYGS